MQDLWATWPIRFAQDSDLFEITSDLRYNPLIRLNDFNNLEAWHASEAQ